MTIWCKHVHRPELQKFLNFCAAHLPDKRDIETTFPYFLFWTCMSEKRNRERSQNKITNFLARLLILIKKGGLLQLKFGVVGVGVNIYLWAR